MSDRKQHLNTPMVPISIEQTSISDLLGQMSQTGFQGKALGQALEIYKKMILDPEVTIFLGYAGSLSTTGQASIVKWLIENRFIDVLVSTGANISEDIFEALGFNYYQGSHTADDRELLEHQIDRYYDVYADELEYRKLEDFIGEFMKDLGSGTYSSAEFLHHFGKFQQERDVYSISTAAYEHGVPIFSPGMADSGYGVAAYCLHKQGIALPVLDQFRDFVQLGELGERAEATAPVYLGGGVPKDTIQLVTVMVDLARGGDVPYPHRYAIQVSTDSPQWGGLSGCTFDEAVSWGKIDPEAHQVMVHCDSTIALPLLVQAIRELGLARDHAPNFDWLWGQDVVTPSPSEVASYN